MEDERIGARRQPLAQVRPGELETDIDEVLGDRSNLNRLTAGQFLDPAFPQDFACPRVCRRPIPPGRVHDPADETDQPFGGEKEDQCGLKGF